MANITIDGKQVTVKDGITVIEAIDQNRVDLPRYCYHPGLSIAGNCRICQVEIEKMPRTVIACNTRVAEGMVIHTQSEKAKESQSTVLEFLLNNHPLDCPVCDQAGECKLQDYYMDYGLYDPKFNDLKHKKTKKASAIGPTIMLDQERCILCTRCVRFADEVTKTHDFGVFNRGSRSELDVYPGKELNNDYSGNVADICPVGALTDRDFRFKMRVWYLGSQKSVCPGCSRGCNIDIHYEKSRPYHAKDRVMRLKPRENAQVNQWWMCDQGRYAYKSIDQGRLIEVGGSLIQKDVALSQNAVDIAWIGAMDHMTKTLGSANLGKWALIVKAQYTNEEIYLMKKIFVDKLKIGHIAFYSKADEGFGDDFLIQKDKNPNTAGLCKILGLESKNADVDQVLQKAKQGQLDGIMVFGHDIASIAGEALWREIRSKVRTIFYEGSHGNVTSQTADLSLPSAVYAEKEGTFTNFQGRVQRIRKALEPMGRSLPTWQILCNLANGLGAGVYASNPKEIFEALSHDVEAFKELNYKSLGDSGVVWRS